MYVLKRDRKVWSRGGEQWLGAESINQKGDCDEEEEDSIHQYELHIKGNYRVQLMSHFSKLPGKVRTQVL